MLHNFSISARTAQSWRRSAGFRSREQGAAMRYLDADETISNETSLGAGLRTGTASRDP
jgi:hypothetical protein